MIKLSDFVIKFIAKLKVNHVFILPGGGCMHLVDSLGKCKEINYVCNLHEQAAAIAAEAYGQYTNNLGVALITTGPGGTNAITGVLAAWTESTPSLFISGQVKRVDMIGKSGVRQMGIQEADIVSIVKPITKYAVTVFDPLTIKFHLEKAVYIARSGRPGPVWIDIPLDIQGCMIDEAELLEYEPVETSSTNDLGILKKQVAETIHLINESERPVLLAGNGIRLAKAEGDFLKLAEILRIPVLITWKAIDLLPEAHELYFGRPGSIAQRGANFIQQNSDCILSIGARLDLAQTGYNHENFAKAAKKVVVDIDPAEIKKLKMNIDVPISADAKSFIQEFLRASTNVQIKDLSTWISHCMNWKTKYPVVLPEYWNQKQYVNTYILIEVLSEEMTENDVFVPGSSASCSEITMQTFKVKRGQRILNSPSLGAMGFGLPASIGACLASGKKRTICINGDGGFQLNIQELETVSRLKLPIKFFILSNQGYSSIKTMQKNYFNSHYVGCDPTSGLTFPNIINIASAYGINGIRISNHKRLREKVKEVMEKEGPIICEVKVDPWQITAPKLKSEVRPDGSIISKPMEDLWPFLDREEFLSNMIIPLDKEQE